MIPSAQQKLHELRVFVAEAIEREREIARLIGEAVAGGELPLALRDERAALREACDDAHAAMMVLEDRARAATARGGQ
jgi:hypothetical protein